MSKKSITIINLILVIATSIIFSIYGKKISNYEELQSAVHGFLFVIIPIASIILSIVGALFSSSCESYRSRYLDSLFVLSSVFYSLFFIGVSITIFS